MTYHCVHLLRSIPVSALVVRIAVFTRTCWSTAGFGPSSDGDHGPPIAIGSFLPRSPTRNWRSRVGCWNESRTSSGSSASAQALWQMSSSVDVVSNITCIIIIITSSHHHHQQQQQQQHSYHTFTNTMTYITSWLASKQPQCEAKKLHCFSKRSLYVVIRPSVRLSVVCL